MSMEPTNNVLNRLIIRTCNRWMGAVVGAQLIDRSLPIPEVHSSNPVMRKNKYWTFTVSCIEKTKIKKKRPVMAHFFKKKTLNGSILNFCKFGWEHLTWALLKDIRHQKFSVRIPIIYFYIDYRRDSGHRDRFWHQRSTVRNLPLRSLIWTI